MHGARSGAASVVNGWGDAVQYRLLNTATGEQFSVPEYILRVEDAGAGGWQLRYGEWTDYPDVAGDAMGTARALALAIEEMTARIEYRGK